MTLALQYNAVGLGGGRLALHEWIQLSTLWTVEYCRPLNQLSISDATSVHGGGVYRQVREHRRLGIEYRILES